MHRGVVRCSLAAALFGASAPAASRLAADVSPFVLAGLLYLGAALAVAPLVARTPPTVAALRSGGSRLALAVLFGGALGPVLLAVGLRHTPAASASLLLNMELVFTVVLAAVAFREHLGGRIVAGTALVVAACIGLGWSGSADVRIGALAIVAACACWGIDNCVTANLDELTPSQITFTKGVVAGSVNLAIGLLAGGGPSAGQTVAALAIGAVGYGASITLWVAGARDLGAARGQLVFATAPFVGALVAWTVLGAPVTARELAALAIAAIGVTCVLGSAHEHEHRHHVLDHEHEHRHEDGHHDHVHGEPVLAGTVHTHRHAHRELVHAHPHVPDLHHHHDH